MIPMVMARHVREGLVDYLDTTYPMVNAPFRGSVERLAGDHGGLSLDPFISIKLPFRTGSRADFPFTQCLHPQYDPYLHQLEAFRRIGSGASTLVATGTGSGKTECFLYPILDYCYRQRRLGNTGIKAILVYPMNALAADQAKRIAETIHGSPELRNNVTAGMYVGKSAMDEDTASTVMGEHAIISDHKALRRNPPDILLTNYKMLDYLLIRPQDSQLWDGNDPNTLKYFVVDELHTFDGAQGTDLACLIRRLSDRLQTPCKDICFVGTSATMGNKPEDARNLCDFASAVFNTPFTPDSIIAEQRQNAETFFDLNGNAVIHTIPSKEEARHLADMEREEDDPARYLSEACRIVLGMEVPGAIDSAGRLQLGTWLRRSDLLRQLVIELNNEPKLMDEELLTALSRQFHEFGQLQHNEQRAVLDALISLVSYARTEDNGHERPFLDVQVQLWTKELRQMRASVCGIKETVRYASVYELDSTEARKYLPIINCRVCGNTGWVGSINERSQRMEAGEKSFTNLYFQFRDDALAVIRPYDENHDVNPNEHTALGYFCPSAECMRFTPVAQFDEADESGESVQCGTCGTMRIPVQMLSLQSVGGGRKHYRCPFCQSDADLSLLGFRATPQMSVMLTELVGDLYNDDKKTIVFSDSVQDAAFRASAFNSRTWRFALRNNAVDYLAGFDEAPSLRRFLDGQYDAYRTAYPDAAEFIMRFTPANMTWMDEYQRVASGNAGGPYQRSLLEKLRNRLRIETLHELGSRSRIGRTLEKTGCAAIGYKQETLASIAMDVRSKVRARIGEDALLEHEEDWLHLTLLLLDTLRLDGAFIDPLYEGYLKEAGNPYVLSNSVKNWMPGSYVRSEPHFASDRKPQRKSGYIPLIGTGLSKGSKYEERIRGYLTNELVAAGNEVQIILNALVDCCLEHGLLQAVESERNRTGAIMAYGLNESECFVCTDVCALRCDSCGRSYNGSAANEDAWVGMHCLNPYCRGRLETDASADELNYYRRLYHTDPPAARIRAAEHTGLVDARTRNALEQRFKQKEAQPGDVNVLACTPTLEMGIDIGDLSTVILSSIPPSQSQYLQRVGRAGRRDGNALVLAVANSRPHDHYYYNRAQEMVSGHVRPPHVFLQASAVLERQLTAFAMDRWVNTSLRQGMQSKDIIPRKLQHSLDAVNTRSGGFPLTFLKYVHAHTAELLHAFTTMFGATDSSIDESLQTALTLFLEGGEQDPSLSARIMDSFKAANSVIEGFEKQRKELEAMKADLKTQPKDTATDERIRECETEIKIVDQNIKRIEKMNVFNYLSNEGILPNYAFPEGGVTLHTVLKPSPEHEEDGAKPIGHKRQKAKTGSYERPAMAAITELAPGNTFYAQGHQFKINRVLFGNEGMESAVTTWRLCPNCSHAEPKMNDQNVANCPVCGDARWAENDQCRPMLKISNVVSEQTYKDSLVSEGEDARSKSMFQTDVYVDIDAMQDRLAWKLNGSTDFGYEYVAHGTLREINFGEAANQGAKMMVNGEAEARQGFIVCSSCGAVKDGKQGMKHAFTCPNRRGLAKTDGTECLFLYREFETEMLRLLVPGISNTRDNNATAASFCAAIMLGLRNKFGNIDHLNAVLSNEPVQDGSGIRKTYLVIFDQVPGGTGYLKQLASDSEEMKQILMDAYVSIDECEYCRTNDQDGCYHCLLGWRQERSFDDISRKLALEMLGPIVNDSGDFESVGTVAEIPVNHLLDSTLEQQFLEALSRTCSQPLHERYEDRGMRCTWVRDFFPEYGEGYTLTVNGLKWEIYLQVDLGPEQGVAVPCRPDFLLHCVSRDNDVQPIAVFTDGLQYHAPIVSEDTLKREALREAGYRVWTLTYDDVMRFVNRTKPAELADPVLNINAMPMKKACRGVMRNKKVTHIDPSLYGAMDLLAYQLTVPHAEDQMEELANAISWGYANPDSRWDIDIEEHAALEQAMQENLQNAGDKPMMATQYHPYHDPDRLGIYFSTFPEDVATKAGRILMDFDDAISTDGQVPSKELWESFSTDERHGFKEQWSSFWHVANLLQYSPYFTFVTDFALKSNMYEPLIEQRKRAEQPEEMPEPATWKPVFEDESFEWLDDTVKQQVRKLSEMHLVVPDEVGTDIEDGQGETMGEAALVWHDRHAVFIPDNPLDDDIDAIRDEYRKNGWLVITAADEQQTAPVRQHMSNGTESSKGAQA